MAQKHKYFEIRVNDDAARYTVGRNDAQKLMEKYFAIKDDRVVEKDGVSFGEDLLFLPKMKLTTNMKNAVRNAVITAISPHSNTGYWLPTLETVDLNFMMDGLFMNDYLEKSRKNKYGVIKILRRGWKYDNEFALLSKEDKLAYREAYGGHFVGNYRFCGAERAYARSELASLLASLQSNMGYMTPSEQKILENKLALKLSIVYQISRMKGPIFIKMPLKVPVKYAYYCLHYLVQIKTWNGQIEETEYLLKLPFGSITPPKAYVDTMLAFLDPDDILRLRFDPQMAVRDPTVLVNEEEKARMLNLIDEASSRRNAAQGNNLPTRFQNLSILSQDEKMKLLGVAQKIKSAIEGENCALIRKSSSNKDSLIIQMRGIMDVCFQMVHAMGSLANETMSCFEKKSKIKKITATAEVHVDSIENNLILRRRMIEMISVGAKAINDTYSLSTSFKLYSEIFGVDPDIIRISLSDAGQVHELPEYQMMVQMIQSAISVERKNSAAVLITHYGSPRFGNGKLAWMDDIFLNDTKLPIEHLPLETNSYMRYAYDMFTMSQGSTPFDTSKKRRDLVSKAAKIYPEFQGFEIAKTSSPAFGKLTEMIVMKAIEKVVYIKQANNAADQVVNPLFASGRLAMKEGETRKEAEFNKRVDDRKQKPLDQARPNALQDMIEARNKAITGTPFDGPTFGFDRVRSLQEKVQKKDANFQFTNLRTVPKQAAAGCTKRGEGDLKYVEIVNINGEDHEFHPGSNFFINF